MHAPRLIAATFAVAALLPLAALAQPAPATGAPDTAKAEAVKTDHGTNPTQKVEKSGKTDSKSEKSEKHRKVEKSEHRDGKTEKTDGKTAPKAETVDPAKSAPAQVKSEAPAAN